MKVAGSTLKKMEVAADARAARKPWQFSILAILLLTSVCSLGLVAIKPYWPLLREKLWPVAQQEENVNEVLAEIWPGI